MNNGYIRLWRKSLDAGWIKNHKLWVFWTWCLLKATYKERDVIVGLQVIRLMPGQFIFGRKKASKEIGLTEQEIRTIIDFLRSRQNLTIKSTNKFSIISIINWQAYQSEDTNEQPTKQPTTNQQLTTNNKVKKVKNNNIPTKVGISSPDAPSDDADRCPHKEIIALYHKTLPELTPVKLWTEKRKAYLRSRWREDKARQDPKWWEGYFQQVRNMPLLMGKVNHFKADLEWLIRPNNMPKVIEGKYLDSDSGGDGTLSKWLKSRKEKGQ